MKNLDLNAYGVTEMNHQEMVETNGGSVLVAAVLGLIALVAAIAVVLAVGKDKKETPTSTEPLEIERGDDYFR